MRLIMIMEFYEQKNNIFFIVVSRNFDLLLIRSGEYCRTSPDPLDGLFSRNLPHRCCFRWEHFAHIVAGDVAMQL